MRRLTSLIVAGLIVSVVYLTGSTMIDTEEIMDFTTDSIAHVKWDVDTSLDDNTAPTPDTLGGDRYKFSQGRVMEWIWAYSVETASDSDTVVAELQCRPYIHPYNYVAAWKVMHTDTAADTGGIVYSIFTCDDIVCPLDWRMKINYWDYSDTVRTVAAAETVTVSFGGRLTVKE